MITCHAFNIIISFQYSNLNHGELMKKSLLTYLLVIGIPCFAETFEPIQKYDMTLSLANKLGGNILAECNKLGKTGAVSVVDSAGNIVIVMRGDNVGPHNTLAAQRKAYTALSTKSNTYELMKKAQDNPEMANLTTINKLLLLGGGVPVIYKDQVIGAVGVAGMGGSGFDNKCAIKGIENTINK